MIPSIKELKEINNLMVKGLKLGRMALRLWVVGTTAIYTVEALLSIEKKAIQQREIGFLVNKTATAQLFGMMELNTWGTSRMAITTGKAP